MANFPFSNELYEINIDINLSKKESQVGSGINDSFSLKSFK